MEKTLIRGARLIDGTGGPAVEPAVLLTARGVIGRMERMRPHGRRRPPRSGILAIRPCCPG